MADFPLLMNATPSLAPAGRSDVGVGIVPTTALEFPFLQEDMDAARNSNTQINLFINI